MNIIIESLLLAAGIVSLVISYMYETESRMIFGSEPDHDYSLGSICAEKPDLDLKDYFINKSFAV